MQKIVLITGSASGFGMLTALEFARQGYYVLATMRNLEKRHMLLQQAESLGCLHNIEVLQLDVTDPHSIDKVFTRVKILNRLDVLINNAGFALGGFAEEITLDEYRHQMETNLYGAIAVTQRFLPIMRKQRSGKIITISSISGLVGFPGLSAYVTSKHAIEGWCESLRLELQPFHIDVVLIEPGSYRTNIWTSGRKDALYSTRQDSPYAHIREKIEDYMHKSMSNYGDPQEVANLIVKVAQKTKPKLRYIAGNKTKLLYRIKNILPWKWWEKILYQQLSIKIDRRNR